MYNTTPDALFYQFGSDISTNKNLFYTQTLFSMYRSYGSYMI